MAEKERGKVLWPAVLTALGLVCIGLVQVGFNAVVGRLHGPAVLGEVNLAISLALLMSTLLSASFVPANTKYVAEYRGREDGESMGTAFVLSLVIVTTGGLVLWALLNARLDDVARALTPLLPNLAGRVDDAGMLFAAALPLVLLHPLYLLTRGMFYATERVERYLRLEAALAVCFFITLGAVVWRGLPLPLPFAVAYALFTVVALHEHRERLAPVRERAREVLADLTHFASRNIVGQFSSMSRVRLGIIIASSYLTMERAGLYAAAYALQSVFYFVPRAVNTVLAPAVSFSFGSGDRERIDRILSEATRLTALVILLIGGACYVAAPLVLSMVYSPAFAPAVATFRLLLLATLATVIAQPALNTLGGTEHIHITGASGALSLVVSLAAWYHLVPAHGIEGIALGFLAGSLTNAVIAMAVAARYFRFSPGVAARPLAIAAVGTIAGMWLTTRTGSGLLGTALFALVYVVATRTELVALADRVRAVVMERSAGRQEEGSEE